ncbi:hypothetical protein BS47DRAFT_1399766 [Hydnum rufescens UP504]|uniref:Putative gamma-glutamylcyclotransferase n=1 Tax=Hydnum rufescens UP504 TaxID=1448309 RepID=A0A9P6DPA6_9AGAM|nr:hypothetical protein BS47DRAFT_1399766 [Hydnum rufescens UP504]
MSTQPLTQFHKQNNQDTLQDRSEVHPPASSIAADVPRDQVIKVPCTVSVRPMFVYGSLMAPSFLAWVITGDPARTDVVEPLSTPACLHGPYFRSSVYGADYPALVSLSDGLAGIAPDTGGVHGILLQHLTRSQRAKIDKFEGETYKVSSIMVTIESSGEEVDADVYMWAGDGVITGKPWDFNVFVRDRLDDWLDIFSGMEMIGEDETETKQVGDSLHTT